MTSNGTRYYSPWMFMSPRRYSPAESMGSRPHPLTEHAAECLDDNHLKALADSALMAAGVLLAAGAIGVLLFGLFVKWLWESLK